MMLLRRITELERENAAIDARRLQAEVEATTQQANYLDLLRHIEAHEHVDFLCAMTSTHHVPVEFRGLCREELLPAVISAYERQCGARVALEANIAMLQETVDRQDERLTSMEEELSLKDELANAHEGAADEFQSRIDILTDHQEKILQENTVLQAAIATQTAQLERALQQLKEREKLRLESLEELDAFRTSVAELQRDVEEQREKIRSLETEREVVQRKLDSSEKRVADGERRLAELAQKDLQEGVDAARKNKRQWLDMIRAVRSAKGGSSGVTTTAASTTTTTTTNPAAGSSIAGSSGGVVALRANAAIHRNALSSSAMSGTLSAMAGDHGLLSYSTTSAPPPPPHHHPHSALSADSCVGERSPVIAPMAESSVLSHTLHHPGYDSSAAAQGGYSNSNSKQPSPDAPHGRSTAGPLPLPPGRLVKGAAPARPAATPVATIAAMAHHTTRVPKSNVKSSMLFQQLLKTRAERAKELDVEKAVAKAKRRTPAPPPMSLQDITL